MARTTGAPMGRGCRAVVEAAAAGLVVVEVGAAGRVAGVTGRLVAGAGIRRVVRAVRGAVGACARGSPWPLGSTSMTPSVMAAMMSMTATAMTA